MVPLTNGNRRARASQSRRPGLNFPKSEYVQSLERGLAVIKAFDAQHPARTLSEVAAAVGITRAAARRFLLTLQSLGYVASDGRYFRLKPQTLELGYAYLASLPWWRYAQQVAENVSGAIKQATAVGVLDRDSVAYVAYSPAAQLPGLARTPGTRLPAHATAIGRVLLAGLPAAQLSDYLRHAELRPLTPMTETSVRRLRKAVEQAAVDGFSVVDQELELGLRAIGVPIRDRAGNTAAAISVSVRDPYLKAAELAPRFLGELRKAAAEITRNLPA